MDFLLVFVITIICGLHTFFLRPIYWLLLRVPLIFALSRVLYSTSCLHFCEAVFSWAHFSFFPPPPKQLLLKLVLALITVIREHHVGELNGEIFSLLVYQRHLTPNYSLFPKIFSSFGIQKPDLLVSTYCSVTTSFLDYLEFSVFKFLLLAFWFLFSR
jgi:hypothetical protein